MQFFCQPQNNPLKLSWSSDLGVGFLEMCSQWVLRCNRVYWKYRVSEWNWRKLIHRHMAQIPSVGGHSPAVHEPHTQNLEWACPGPLCPRFSFVSFFFFCSLHQRYGADLNICGIWCTVMKQTKLFPECGKSTLMPPTVLEIWTLVISQFAEK